MKLAVSLALVVGTGCGVSQESTTEDDSPPGTESVGPAPTSGTLNPMPTRRYSIVPIPTGVASGSSEAARAICSSMNVVGSATYNSINEAHAVVFDGSTNTDLGTLGGLVSRATDGNAAGTIVGVASTASPSGEGSGPGHAFMYKAGVMTDLGGIGGQYSEAHAINSREQIVGQAALPGAGDTPNHAVLWENCVAIDLGTLDGNYSFARDINDSGDIVGTAVTANNQSRAILWSDGAMIVLDHGSASDAQALAINEAGTIAGFTRSPDRAVVWKFGVMTDLGTLGGSHAVAKGINERGDVVGDSTTVAEDRAHAFLYENGTMIALEQFVDTSRWQLLEGTDVCNDGRIVGNGLLDGISRGFVMTPIP